jgi:hypothetical protein
MQSRTGRGGIALPFAKGLVQLFCGLAVALAASPLPAAADSAYCRAVRARASADASLLMSPQIVAQALRYPDFSIAANGAGSGRAQARAGLAYSLVDLYKGFGVLSVAEAECEAHASRAAIEDLLLQGIDLCRLPALRAQVAFLEQKQGEWQSLLSREEERFARRLITLTELTEIRLRAAELERKLARAGAELRHLSSTGARRPDSSLSSLSGRYLARAGVVEQRVSHLRSLSAWQLKLAGGATTTSADGPDWYGLLEVSFNLGAFAERRSDARFLEAQREALATDPAELVGHLEELKKRMRGTRSQAASELVAIERHRSQVAQARHTLEGAEPAVAAHAAAMLSYDDISIGAEETYLRALRDELETILQEEGHHE